MSERWEAEFAERNEARNAVTFLECNLDHFERILYQVRNDKYVLREETEVCIGTPFGVLKLKPILMAGTGRNLRDSHGAPLPFSSAPGKTYPRTRSVPMEM